MTRQLTRWLVLSLFFTLIAGTVFTGWTVVEKEGQMRDQLLTQVRLSSVGIHATQVAALTGSEVDLTSADYQELKIQMVGYRTVDPDIRFAYLIGRRADDTYFFYVDSEPPESEDYSPPGQEYPEVTEVIKKVFSTGTPLTEGPATDRWGTWISGIVPVTDPVTGTTVAVYGMDVDARNWIREIITSALVPVLVTGMIAGILYLFFILQQRTQRENQRLAASEAALHKSEEKYRLIADNTADNIWILDLDLNLKYISPSVKRMRGFTVEEAMELTLEQRMSPESRESLLTFIHDEQAREAGGTADPKRIISLETTVFCKDGSTLLIESTIACLRDEDLHPIGIIGISRDITERKRMETDLQASLKEKETLLREIHHRVKNNLQIVISLLNLQIRHIEDKNTQGLLRECQSRISAMSLVHEKLYKSTDVAKFDLDEYVRFLGNSLFEFYGMKGKGITFTTKIPDVALEINTAIPFCLILNELLTNSLKYAFPEGRKGAVSVSIHREDHLLTILYNDTGVGIPPDFDWRNAKSMGLRLIISLVEQLSGTIELDRTTGTTFKIIVKEHRNTPSS